MDPDRTPTTQDRARGRSWPPADRGSGSAQWHLLDTSYRSTVGRSAGTISLVPDLPSTVPGVGGFRHAEIDLGMLGRGSAKSGQARSVGVLYRRHPRGGEKRWLCVGATKRGKGTKIMAVADRHGLPVAVHFASASPHEVT